MEYFNDPIGVANELKIMLENGDEPLPNSAQHPLDLEAWNIFFKLHKINTLIELGTGSGSFSKVLQKKVRNFLTFDNIEPYHDIRGFKKVDILSDHKYISEKISLAERPFLLYCDNGNKPKEVKMYSPFLEVGDFLATHDFQIEISPEDIPEEFELILNLGLTAFFQKAHNG